jgi:hypothetical protein
MKAQIKLRGATIDVDGAYHQGTMDGQDPSRFFIHSVAIVKGARDLVSSLRKDVGADCGTNVNISNKTRTLEELQDTLNTIYRANDIPVPKRVKIWDEIEQAVIKLKQNESQLR